jgi:hypothetical protein
MNLAEAFQRIGLGKVGAVAGGVYALYDSVIKIPDGDLAGNRTKHDFRTIIILSNQNICNSIACPVVTVVPLSRVLTPRAETDLIIGKDAENNLEHDSRLMFGYIQPILKSDLRMKIGVLSESDWHNVMGKMVWNFDR